MRNIQTEGVGEPTESVHNAKQLVDHDVVYRAATSVQIIAVSSKVKDILGAIQQTQEKAERAVKRNPARGEKVRTEG